jgi:hypothetical protein
MNKIIVAGLSGGTAMNLAMLLTFRTIGFGWDGRGILLSSPIQSHKLIAVWTQIEPLPLVVNTPLPIIVGMLFFGVVHAYIYRHISSGWPQGIAPRSLRMTGLIFCMTYLFWEFFTPFNQFGEPLLLIALELLFWAIIAFAEAVTITTIMEKEKS